MKTCSNRLLGLAVALAAASLSIMQATADSFATTGSLSGSRAGHTATLLRNGTVLVFGGYNGSVRLNTAELYDPASGAWSPSGALAIGRTTQTATLLPNGDVLAAGGHISAYGSTSSCEVYDPIAGIWAQTGSMATPRGIHTATLLLNGKVLVAGGFNRNTGSALLTAELYDPVTGNWTLTGSLAVARDNQTATLLLNGKVLVTGGAPDSQGDSSLSSAEIYDPDSGAWTTIASMSIARQNHTATLLPDGRVLVAGGADVGYFNSSAEIYDPVTGVWTSTGAMQIERGIHTATLLPNGKVLAAGGNHNTASAPTIVTLSSAELYDPLSGTWALTGSLNAARTTHTATLLPSGRLLLSAGYYANSPTWLSSAELFDSTAMPMTLMQPALLSGGAFQFLFNGAPNSTNAVLATTNPMLPLSNWTVVGTAPELSPGLFLFNDTQAANSSRRFYCVRSP